MTPVSKKMLDRHWVEALPMELAVGDVKINSRIHRKSIPEDIIKGYQSLENRTITFNSYLQEKINQWNNEKRVDFLKRVIKVKYFSEKTLSHLSVSFGEEGTIKMPDSNLAHFVENVEKIKDKAFASYIKTLKESPVKLLPVREYICILDVKSELTIAYKVGQVFHSSLSQGEAVLFAGRVQISQVDGKNVITGVNVNSGHYRHNKEELIQLLKFLKKKGVNTDALQIDIRGKKLKGIEIGN